MCVSDCSQGCQKKTLIPFLQILVRKNIIIDLSSVVFNELHKILKDSFATSFTREGAVHLFVFCVARRASWVWPHLPPLVSSYCESLSISTARYFFEKVILFIFCGCFNSGFLRGCNVGSQGRQGGASVLFWWRRFGEVIGTSSWVSLKFLVVLCPLDHGESSLVLFEQIRDLPDLFLWSIFLVQRCNVCCAIPVLITNSLLVFLQSFREAKAEICVFVSSLLPPISPLETK